MKASEVFHYGMSQMRKQRIIQEIKTSSLWKNCTKPMPGMSLSESYRRAGGTCVTVGVGRAYADGPVPVMMRYRLF